MNKHERNRAVAVARCAAYDDSAVAAALAEVLKPFGGMAALVRPGQRVCLKVNLLRPSKPEAAVTTHPAVVKAVALAVRAAGAMPFLADSPGGGLPHTDATLKRGYDRCGYTALAAEIGLELNDDTSSREVHFDGGRVARRFNVMAPVLDADAVINLCKLKNHAFTYLTGAVKNLFGVLPGYDKPGYHGRLQKVDFFAEMLVDVALFVKPVINVMDAVVAMEGNGPGLGDPRPLGLLLASVSPLAVDCAMGVLTGLPPEKHPALRVAAARGLAPTRADQLVVFGPALADVAPGDWKWPPTLVVEHGFGGLGPFQKYVSRIMREAFSVQPRIAPERCTGCGHCREACPVGAVEVLNLKSHIEEKLCIRCYCCHEACPYDAIDLKRGLLNRLAAVMK